LRKGSIERAGEQRQIGDERWRAAGVEWLRITKRELRKDEHQGDGDEGVGREESHGW
jgi:hypothetical protein